MTTTHDIIKNSNVTVKRDFVRTGGRGFKTIAQFISPEGESVYLSVLANPDAHPNEVDILNHHMEEIRVLDRCPDDFQFEMEREDVRRNREAIIATFGQENFDALYANGEKFNLF